MANVGATDDLVANPAPDYSFGDVADRFFQGALNVGGNYLTQKGQVDIAQANAAAQARLNGYSAVNPSLGAVNPAAAAQLAGQTLIQRFLPTGSPSVGVPASGGQPSAGLSLGMWLVLGAVAILGVFLIVRLVRK